MKTRKHLLVAAVAALFASVTSADEEHAVTQGQLGRVLFKTSCSADAQAVFDRALAMLHSFWFTEAGKTFGAALEKDPNCAIAYWGIAVNQLGNPLATRPSLKDLQAGSAVLDKARALNTGTPKEREWIEAISVFYRDHEKRTHDERLAAYAKAMAAMAQHWPDDDEVWIFDALAIQAAAPTNDKTYAEQRRAAEILEKQFAKNPLHPGAAHYLIHAYDYPPLAQQGLPAARKYATIAPAAPHARHMPSHVYSMLGLWEESVASNMASLEVQSDYYHAMDFAVYAHLQLAQDAKALAMIERARDELTRKPALLAGNKNAAAAIPARYMLERGDWAGAAALPITASDWPYADSLTRFARGVGMARSGDLAGARSEIEVLKTQRTSLAKANLPYWAERVDEEIYAVSAWVALREGQHALAEKLLRAAAEGEDASVKNVAMENRLYPMRELLADLLLELRQPALAQREYDAALAENPNRYRALYGAAMAAEAAGDRVAARGYSEKLVALTRNADGVRPELARAKALVAQQ